jgi:hypothetical protein
MSKSGHGGGPSPRNGLCRLPRLQPLSSCGSQSSANRLHRGCNRHRRLRRRHRRILRRLRPPHLLRPYATPFSHNCRRPAHQRTRRQRRRRRPLSESDARDRNSIRNSSVEWRIAVLPLATRRSHPRHRSRWSVVLPAGQSMRSARKARHWLIRPLDPPLRHRHRRPRLRPSRQHLLRQRRNLQTPLQLRPNRCPWGRWRSR